MATPTNVAGEVSSGVHAARPGGVVANAERRSAFLRADARRLIAKKRRLLRGHPPSALGATPTVTRAVFEGGEPEGGPPTTIRADRTRLSGPLESAVEARALTLSEALGVLSAVERAEEEFERLPPTLRSRALVSPAEAREWLPSEWLESVTKELAGGAVSPGEGAAGPRMARQRDGRDAVAEGTIANEAVAA